MTAFTVHAVSLLSHPGLDSKRQMPNKGRQKLLDNFGNQRYYLPVKEFQ